MADKIQKITAPVRGTYEGKPTLSIPLASGKPFTFGVEKAAAILKHLEAVQSFNKDNPAKDRESLAAKVAGMSETEKAELQALLAAAK